MPYKLDRREYLNRTCTNNFGFHMSYSDHNPCFTFDPDGMQMDRGVIPGTLKIKGSYITYLRLCLVREMKIFGCHIGCFRDVERGFRILIKKN